MSWVRLCPRHDLYLKMAMWLVVRGHVLGMFSLQPQVMLLHINRPDCQQGVMYTACRMWHCCRHMQALCLTCSVFLGVFRGVIHTT
jgi:hypothetical protein